MTARTVGRGSARGGAVPALWPEGVVAGRFQVRGVLGVGGTGTVFEAHDEVSGEDVALKAIPRDETLDRRARRELRVAQTLDHPAVVRLLDYVEDDDYVYMAFELVRGQDLTSAFRDGVLDDAGVLRAVAAVCDALAHAHAHGVVHRDVKPGNVLLRDDGVLKLTDFGVALVDHPEATVDDRILGTLSYMAPEQVAGRVLTGAADVWAAALMAFEALTGENPYRARTPRDVADRHAAVTATLATARPDLPPGALRVIDRALCPDPDRRPEAGALRDALLAGARTLEQRAVDATVTQGLDRTPPGADVGPRLRALGDALRRNPGGSRRRRGAPASPHLNLVPVTVDRPPLRDLVEGRLRRIDLERLRVPAVDPARRAALERAGSAVLLGAAAALGTAALPFWPAGWPVALGLLVGLASLVLPRVAGLVAVLLALPAVGNLSLALVVPVALAAGCWLAACSPAPRRLALPLLAIPATALALWPLYLLAAATARSVVVRLAAGAAGPVAVALASGLRGNASALSEEATGVGLAGRVAGADDVVAVSRALLEAAGVGLAVQALLWGLLALAARPLLALDGARLRFAGAAWLAAAAAGTVLGPALVGGPRVPFVPTAVAVILAAILLGIRSVVPTAGRNPGRGRGHAAP